MTGISTQVRGPRTVPSRETQRLLAGIGTPLSSPFKPDPFQQEALAALEFEDVLVTAPTGSGKTWIAREEIRRLLAAGRSSKLSRIPSTRSSVKSSAPNGSAFSLA